MKKTLYSIGFLFLISLLSFTSPLVLNNANVNLIGIVRNSEGDRIENVVVRLMGGGLSLQTSTDAGGNYSFIDIPDNQVYAITLEKNSDLLNGVSTFDLVLISKHILDVLKLSIYKQLAADVDGNGVIDIVDMLYIRQLQLNPTTTFPNDLPSWGFVPVSHSFGVTPFPNPFPNSATSITVNGNTTADFIGFKRGDASNSANTRP